MNRSTWRAVTLTTLALLLTGFGSRVPWTRVTTLARTCAPAVERVIRDATDRVAVLGLSVRALAEDARVPIAARELPPAAVLAAVGALLLVATLLPFVRRRRNPRRVAERMLRRGGENARAARRAGLARDAMRLVLRSGRA
jgi:hypothetical protein